MNPDPPILSPHMCGMPKLPHLPPYQFANKYQGGPSPVVHHPHAPNLCHTPVQALCLPIIYTLSHCTATDINSLQGFRPPPSGMCIQVRR
jgi:hypothetical protein